MVEKEIPAPKSPKYLIGANKKLETAGKIQVTKKNSFKWNEFQDFKEEENGIIAMRKMRWYRYIMERKKSVYGSILYGCFEQVLDCHNSYFFITIFNLLEKIIESTSTNTYQQWCPHEIDKQNIHNYLLKFVNHFFYSDKTLKTIAMEEDPNGIQPFTILVNMIAEFCEQEIINSWSSYPGNTSRLNPGDKSNEYLVSVKYYEKIIEQLQKHLNYKVVFLLDISNKIYTYKRDLEEDQKSHGKINVWLHEANTFLFYSVKYQDQLYTLADQRKEVNIHTIRGELVDIISDIFMYSGSLFSENPQEVEEKLIKSILELYNKGLKYRKSLFIQIKPILKGFGFLDDQDSILTFLLQAHVKMEFPRALRRISIDYQLVPPLICSRCHQRTQGTDIYPIFTCNQEESKQIGYLCKNCIKEIVHQQHLSERNILVFTWLNQSVNYPLKSNLQLFAQIILQNRTRPPSPEMSKCEIGEHQVLRKDIWELQNCQHIICEACRERYFVEKAKNPRFNFYHIVCPKCTSKLTKNEALIFLGMALFNELNQRTTTEILKNGGVLEPFFLERKK